MECKKMDEGIYIPMELLCHEILPKLPVKSLLKFRCVCKLWCSIIDSQDFRIHPKIRKSPPLLHIEWIDHGWTGCHNRVTLRSIDTFEIVDYLCETYGTYEFHETCNGLMLMSQELIREKRLLRIWNPSIRKSLALPSCPLSSDPCIFRWTSEPCDHLLTYMMGYPSSDDGDHNFKVAAFKHYQESSGSLIGETYVSIAIYSSRGHSWSSAINRNDVLFPPSLNNRVFYQGAWYWITRTHLVSFDFDSEDFSYVELPVDVMEGKITRFIFLVCEKLAVLSVSSKCFCVWVMDMDSSRKPSWRPWLSRDSTIFEDLLKETRCRCKCLSHIHSRIFYNERDSGTFIFQTRNEMFSYSFSTRQVQILRSPYISEVTVDAYAESLVLHKGTDDQILTSSYPPHDSKKVVAWPTFEDNWKDFWI